MPIVHDKGISRLPGLLNIEKDKWYFGFICKKCGKKIFALDNPAQWTSGQIAIGRGKFSVPCFFCETNDLLYNTPDLIPVQANKSKSFSKATPRRKPSNSPKQPLLKKYSKAKPTYGITFLEERPDCAIIYARCISIWSYIEVELALLLASILKINHAPAMAIFLSLRNNRNQTEVINAAAKSVLSGSDLELYEAHINIKNSYESSRNDLVHGLIGGSQVVKDGILWISQQNSVGQTAQVWASDYNDMSQERVLNNTFVYEPEDLETIAENFEWLHKAIGFFRGYISSDDATWRSQRYLQLCAEPRLAKELARMRNGQKRTS